MRKCKNCEIEFETKSDRQKFHNMSCYHRWFKREEYKKKRNNFEWISKQKLLQKNYRERLKTTPEGRAKLENKWRRRKLFPRHYYTNYKNEAKRKELHFNIDFNFFMNNFWQKPCYYCGDIVKNGGMDRIDSSKGYYVGNVVPCCTMCNIMKLNHPAEVWINHMKKILKYIPNKK